MCLIIKKNQRKVKAKKDIIVYKVLYKRYNAFFSPIEGYQYTLNKLNIPVELERRIGGMHDKIYRGYHSFARLREAIEYNTFTSEIVLKAIIPSGTYYMRGLYNEYASENIIVTDEILYVK